MVDPITSRLLIYRSLFVATLAVMCFARMLPLGQSAGSLPGPDLMVALTFAWVLRRPAYVPAPLIVAVFLPIDLLLQRPPGLWALAVMAGAEVLRARQGVSRDLPFPAEWAMVTGVLLAMVGAYQVALTATLTPRPPLGLQLLQALFTAAIYPLAVLLSAWLFRIRKATPGEVDALGDRL